MDKGFNFAKLVLDEPRAIYYAGQLLKGHIECELNQPLNFTAINVTFTGEANVHWTETETEEYNGVRRVAEVSYTGHEDYFNYTQCIYGGNGVTQIPAGPHTIPFQYQIPPHVPSSFSRARGHVRYTVSAYIDYPDPRAERDELIKEFEVVAPLDLNTCEDLKQPIELEFEEFYSCCCSSTPLNIVVSLPAGGFCPGQTIPVRVRAKNDTTSEVKKMKFQLVQRECYRSQEPASEYFPPEEVLETIHTGPILAHSKREFTYNLVVPDLIAPNLDKCKIIDVGYFFKVLIKMSGCNDDLEDEAEIYLGLVPFSDSPGADEFTHPMVDSLPIAEIPAPVAEIPAQYPQPYPNANQAYPDPIHAYPKSYPAVDAHYPNNSYPSPYPVYPNDMAMMPVNNTMGFTMPQPSYPAGQYPHPQPNIAPMYPGIPPVSPSAPPPS